MTDDQLEGLNVDDSFYQVTILEEQLRAMTPDLEAIAAYKAKEADFAAKQAELSAATGERDVVGSVISSCTPAYMHWLDQCASHVRTIMHGRG